MIILYTDQKVLNEPEWAVKIGGEYNPSDLIECYRIEHPEQSVSYYAQYIIDGSFP